MSDIPWKKFWRALSILNLNFILKYWQEKSYEKGSIVQFSDQKGVIKKGKFLGLDELGGLMIEDSSGVKKMYSGDVYFGS